LPSVSYLAPSHVTADFSPDGISGVTEATRHAGVTFAPRGKDEAKAFFDRLGLIARRGPGPALATRR
jgi:hypothetical protein